MIIDTTPPKTLGKDGPSPTVLMDALKAMWDLHDLGLVTCVYPEGSRGHAQVEAATQKALLTLAATRRYGKLYARKGGDT